MTEATKLDFLFSKITDVHFGGTAWVLINALISGFVSGTTTPPPYGTFSWQLPKTTHFLSQNPITRTQHSHSDQPSVTKFYFLWASTAPALPTADDYNLVITSPGALPAFASSFIPFTYGDQFSVILSDQGDGWFSSLAAADAAIPRANAFGAAEALPIWISATEDSFTFPNTFTAHELDITGTSVPSADTELQVQFLFAVPDGAETFTFTTNVPANSSVSGWASIFTDQKKDIKRVSDLTGLADQSVYLAGQSATHGFTIQTTGKLKAGTITADGAGGFSPGLAVGAPISP